MNHLPVRRAGGLSLLGMALLSGLLCLGPHLALAQSQGNVETAIAANLHAGQQALVTKNYEEAIDLWQQGLEDVQNWGATAYETTYYFNLGLAWQQWGEDALHDGDATLSRDLLNQAEHQYQTLLERNPTSAGTYNNLARLYAKMERHDAATEAYERAIAIEDERQPLFLLNYADFLRQQGHERAALGHYRRVLEARPDNERAHEGLAEAYWATDRQAMIGYMWDLINGGQEIMALDIALDKLATSAWRGGEAVIARQKTALLTCVALGLSLGRYAPESLLESDRGRTLRTLSAEDRHIGTGARELLLLHLPEDLTQASFKWWISQTDDEDSLPGYMWPRDAFHNLIRARGTWHQQQKQDDVAEQYYLLSVRLPGDDSYPEALLHLAKMYFRAGSLERIDDLLNQYGDVLFEGKLAVLRKAQWDKAYEYHRTLGIMYAYVGRWGDTSTVTSAIFQLEAARHDADQYNETLQKDDAAQRIRVEPQMIDLLAQGYEATDQADRAMTVRLEAAEAYERQGDQEASDYLLKPLENRTLPKWLQQRYDRILQNRLVDAPPPN